MRPPLDRRALWARERMDAPDCDPAALRRTYRQFRLVNAAVSGWHAVYRRELRPLLSPERPSRLLDVGCGGGDLPLNLARWAAHDGLRLNVTGIDPDGRAIHYARSLPGRLDVRFVQAASGDLVARGETFDFVTSNHLLHHLSGSELAALLRDSAALCRVKVIHGDIERSPLAYAAFGLATWPFFRGSFIRQDGLTSIRRSYTAPELRAAAPPGWTVRRQFPYRNLLIYTPARCWTS